MDERITAAFSADNTHKLLSEALKAQLALDPRYEVEPEVDMILKAVAQVVAQQNGVLLAMLRSTRRLKAETAPAGVEYPDSLPSPAD